MGLLHAFLDLVLPPSAAVALLFVWPALAFFKAAKWAVSLVVHEDVRGKVVLITGASSGIGEHITYQYARKGARLVLVARREGALTAVADRAVTKGASDVKVIVGDVTKEHECKLFVEETIEKYGRLDHLVNNAGVAHSFFFDQAADVKGLKAVMDTTFFGSMYMTYFALPHLRRSRGKILVIASVASWLPYPRQSVYNAAKAAVLAFFDTLRVEAGDAVGITIVMPGWVESEISKGKMITERGDLAQDQRKRDAHVGPVPVAPVDECAKVAVNGVIRGDRYVTFPSYYSVFLLYRVFTPEILEWVFRLFYVVNPPKPPAKQVLEATQASRALYPTSIQKKE